MSPLEELMVLITTNDRLNLLKFRSYYVKKYGQASFTKLLSEAEEALKGD